MRLPLTALLCATVIFGCSTGQQPPGVVEGRIAMQVLPNPIEARPLAGDSWEFPFTIVLTETGGSEVQIQQVSARVESFGGLVIANEIWPAARIREKGYPTVVPAGAEVRYRFTERHHIPDERLLQSVAAVLTVEGIDASGKPTSATIRVTVRRG